ncbi:MAG TPA: adenylate/guanylate cyclase domain-containing protein [Herpetosiphonaceae bacterium]|nr:adenylate/guanylate cyclase domain-containing protein [Herpetosiphonaceae bacterium]
MSLLIVDDSAAQRFALTTLLKKQGYDDLLTAESASQAFAILGRGVPDAPPTTVDLILMDISMPDIDGIAACRQIKNDPRLHDIPVIMVTSSADTEDLQTAFEAGAMDYLIKPPSPTELVVRVRSALNLKHEIDRRKAREEDLLEAARVLGEERAKSDQLLLNILPQPIADRLKQSPGIIADKFSAVTVLFADIVDFTQRASQIGPVALVTLLDEVFSAFDALAERHGLEKIKTIGDAYMVAGGLPMPRADHARAAAAMALDMQAAVARLGGHGAEPIQIRIGLHSGPVVAGVIGSKKFIYDLWGDTVNIASRMESLGATGAIQITRATYDLIKDDFACEPRGTVSVKGKGNMDVWHVVGGRG